jgi:uncharacterized protein YcbX
VEPRVAWITVAPVKGLALVARDEIELMDAGAPGDRRFYLVDASGRLANGKRFGTLVEVTPEYDEAAATLRLRGPAGLDVSAEIELGEPIVTSFYGRPVSGTIVVGPLSDVLSDVAGAPLRLVAPDRRGDAVDRGADGLVTMLGTGSLEQLAARAGVEAVDARRFRMLIGVSGIAPHEEDGWIGSHVSVGGAVVAPVGNVGRCSVTTRNPDTGAVDLPTLDVLTSYRGVMETTEPLPFGISARVVLAGRVAVGDRVVAG